MDAPPRISRARAVRAALLGGVLLPIGVAWGAITAVGEPIHVDGLPPEATPPNLYDPDVAGAADGGFLVVWPGFAESGETIEGITRARSFDAGGQPTSAPVDLGIHYSPGASRGASILAFESEPAVASGPAGEFVVVWPSLTWPGLYFPVEDVGLDARRVSSDGQPLGEVLRVVDGDPSGFPQKPDVAFAPGGDFVIVWEDYAAEHTLSLRHYAGDGTPLGDPVAIADAGASANFELAPAIVTLGEDEALVVWRSRPAGGAITYRVLAQLMDTDGVPLAASTEVSELAIDAPQLTPAVAVLPSGGAFVAWDSEDDDVLGRVVDASGAPQGSALTLDGSGGKPWLVATSTNEVVAVWGNDGPGDLDVAAQILDAGGAPVGPVLLGRFATGSGLEVAGLRNGRRLVATGSLGGGAIQARIFLIGLPLFEDGFESGDECAWSSNAGGADCS